MIVAAVRMINLAVYFFHSSASLLRFPVSIPVRSAAYSLMDRIQQTPMQNKGARSILLMIDKDMVLLIVARKNAPENAPIIKGEANDKG